MPGAARYRSPARHDAALEEGVELRPWTFCGVLVRLATPACSVRPAVGVVSAAAESAATTVERYPCHDLVRKHRLGAVPEEGKRKLLEFV